MKARDGVDHKKSNFGHGLRVATADEVRKGLEMGQTLNGRVT